MTTPIPFLSLPAPRASTQPRGDGEGAEARETREFFTALGKSVLTSIKATLEREDVVS